MNRYLKFKQALLILGTATLAAWMSSCGKNADTSGPRSTYYTRGIGQYPGCPQEDFSPELLPDDTYRNLARMRAAYQSSSYDYNLTAQLVTDGIVTREQPQWLNLSTPDGDKPRREREWMIDEGPYSRNVTIGEDTYFQFSLHEYSKRTDRLYLRGTLAYHADVAGKGYEIDCQGSNDGTHWELLGRTVGKGLPGKPSRQTMHSDPNKQSEQGNLPVRIIEQELPLERISDFTHYRICFKMPGAAYWTIHDLNFYLKDEIVEMKPSQFFNSAWMSAGNGEEWIYVDLGTVSTFDRVILHWIDKASEGEIQTSDDARQWSRIASLPGGEAPTDEIAVKGKARYVRVLMRKPLNGERYILSELEVMGRGGLLPHPAPQPEPADGNMLLAGGRWKLQRASEVQATGEAISTPDYKPDGWVTATVPGTVLSSYKNIGALPDPNYADNQLNLSESFFNANFWYRNEFTVPKGFTRQHTFLCFDGINWKANVYLNGQRAGRLEGAFVRGKFDVTDLIVPGKNVLAVEIVKNSHIGAVKEKNKQSTDFNGGILGADNPTFHATIGWDWIPTIRGRNIGIWNDVRLTTTGPVTVSDPLVESVFPLPDTTSVRLTARVWVKNHEPEAVKGMLEGRIGDIDVSVPVELEGGEEREVVLTPDRFPALALQHPRLWWPNGYGEPYLYDASFTFRTGDAPSDRKDFKVGIRQMTFNEDNGILNLYINGRRFIGRGGNWGFSESNLNYRGREYDAAVAYHADMNFNILRNWVGMIGDEELYEACDRHGILVWQDFWLANPADGPDPYYPDLFIANAEDYVRRIRSHASLGLYCGRNEGFPPEQIDNALRRIVKEVHPGLHYISSSADEVVSGHGPYRMLPAKTYFTLETGNDKFHSERGMPNVLTYEGFLRTYSPEGIWPQSDEWGMHDYALEGAQGATSFNEIIARGYGEPQSAKEFAELAQWVNYDGHRSLFESRSKNRMGLLMWMSHPCWPSMVWQTYDYYLEPTAAYFAIKKASEPLHIQWNPATDDVEIVNYSAGSRKGLTVKAQVLNMDASIAWEKEMTADSDNDSTNKCLKLTYPDGLSKVHFIRLQLHSAEGKVLSDNFYHRSLEEGNYTDLKRLPQAEPDCQVTSSRDEAGNWQATVCLTNRSAAPALMTRINVKGDRDGDQFLPILYSDNYFALLPGEQKTVTVRWKDVDTRGNRPVIHVSGYNVAEKAYTPR